MTFDWRHPDYTAVFAERARRLSQIRRDPTLVPMLRLYYRDHPIEFIQDWGQTSDPRNADIGLPVNVPFLLFPRQVEWCEWVLESWRARRPGVTPKSRESGVSWMAIALSCTLCNFRQDIAIGFGSRKLELVDTLGDPKSLFWKAREFMLNLPPEFTDNWQRRFAPEKLIRFPHTGSSMAGEGGDEIGRGARTTLYFVDESASIERPSLIDQSLLSTTNCRIDISTAKGSGNPFHRKVTTWPLERVFRFHWRDDPRKDEAWYAKQLDESDPVTIAQEVDINFSASVDHVVIPSAWVQAAVDAHVKLGIRPTGQRHGALDVADEGADLNAFGVAHGVLLEHVEEWSGKGDDIYKTVLRAFDICDERGLDGFRYDADGLGAGVRGDARVINEGRHSLASGTGRILGVVAFRGSAAVVDPEREDTPGRKNEDHFRNLKAQSWWALRKRFETTWRAVDASGDVESAQNYDRDAIISISSAMPANVLNKLMDELSQPTHHIGTTGKREIDKKPDGTRSPNMADVVMMLFGRGERPPMRIAQGAVEAIMGIGRSKAA